MIGLAEKILFDGVVIDNEDVFLLNRIRVKPNFEKIQEILDSYDSKFINDDKSDFKQEYWYKKDDPFVFYPIYPSITAVPDVGDLVWVTYSNPSMNKSRKEQFYYPSSKTNPFNIAKESFKETYANTSQGFNTILGKQFKSDKINPDTGKKDYFDPKLLKGVFAEPGDNSFYGRGTTDVILKPDEVLIRAGKTKTMFPNSTSNSINEKRAFLQMSYFRTKYLPEKAETQQSSVINESPLRKLIEYVLYNPENTEDKFTGNIYIYDIPKSAGLKNNVFTPETVAPKSQIFSYFFSSLPMSSVTYLINTVITGLNDGLIDIKEPFIPKKRAFEKSEIFPFYYRPSELLQQKLSTSPKLTSNPAENAEEYNSIMNISKLVTSVRFPTAVQDMNGSGLISRKNKFGISKDKQQINVSKTETVNETSSVTILGSTEICLLSNETADYLTTSNIYGISQPEFYQQILPRTEPLVRGEKLKQFLNLIVNFLTTHVHPYHGLPPNPTSFSNVTVTQIEENFQKYDSEVLNQNIRIN